MSLMDGFLESQGRIVERQTEIPHADGSTTIVTTLDNGYHNVKDRMADGREVEIGTRGSAETHEHVVKEHERPGDGPHIEKDPRH